MTPAASLRIGSHAVHRGKVPLLVAELACAHQGDPGKARALVDAAAAAGADAVQFELFVPERNMARSAPLYPVIEGLALAPSTWIVLAEQARAAGLAVIAYVYDEGAAAFAADLAPDASKLNASDLLNPALLDHVASAGRPFTLGTGAATAEEIGWALARVLAAGGSELVLMHGVQSFPTPLAEARIGRLRWLEASFGALVGYADHTPAGTPEAELADLLALGAGAVILEKHLILDRARDEIDRSAALEPEEWRRWAERIRLLAPAMQGAVPQPLDDAETRYRAFQRKKPVASRDLPAGHVLDATDLELLRHPDPGLPAHRELVGRRLARPVAAARPLTEADLAP